MLYDREKNSIQTVEIPNGHFLVVGQSGQGKTYFCCRKIEEEYRMNRKILILDYSGSYTKEELVKNDFAYAGDVRLFNPFEHIFYLVEWYEREEILVEDLKDILLKAFGITSYYQKKLVQEAVAKMLIVYKEWSFPNLISILEEMLMIYEESDGAKGNVENILHLLTRFEPFGNIRNLKIKKANKPSVNKGKRIVVIQLSEFPEQQKRVMTEIMLQLFYKESLRLKSEKKFDVILLDEFQFLSVKGDSILSAILREGRKFNLSVILSSQFISHYEREEIQTLMQAANILIFKPTSNDIRFTVQIISNENCKNWECIIRSLKRGEAILVGTYHINDGKKIITTPIVCEID